MENTPTLMMIAPANDSNARATMRIGRFDCRDFLGDFFLLVAFLAMRLTSHDCLIRASAADYSAAVVSLLIVLALSCDARNFSTFSRFFANRRLSRFTRAFWYAFSTGFERI